METKSNGLTKDYAQGRIILTTENGRISTAEKFDVVVVSDSRRIVAYVKAGGGNVADGSHSPILVFFLLDLEWQWSETLRNRSSFRKPIHRIKVRSETFYETRVSSMILARCSHLGEADES